MFQTLFFFFNFPGKTFAHTEGLKNHVRTIHEGIRYQCDYCEKSFTQQNNLKLHIKNTHECRDPPPGLNPAEASRAIFRPM